MYVCITDASAAVECVLIIDGHPEIARQMRGHLAGGWREVGEVANEIQSVTIDSDADKPATLSACESADVFVDQQAQARLAVHKISYRHLRVARREEYELKLHRRSEESGFSFADACPETEVTDCRLIEGRALPIASARVFIQGRRKRVEVGEAAKSAESTPPLNEGPALLHTWFDAATGRPLCSTY